MSCGRSLLSFPCLVMASAPQKLQRMMLPITCMLSFASAFSTSPYSGCGKPLPGGQSPGAVANVTISSGGLARNYLLFVPPTYHAFSPTPLILSYHGGSKTAQDQLLLDQLTTPKFNTESFVIYPQGINVRICLADSCETF